MKDRSLEKGRRKRRWLIRSLSGVSLLIGGIAFWFRQPFSPLKRDFLQDVAALKARQSEITGSGAAVENLPELLQRYLDHCGYLDAPQARWMSMCYKDVAFLMKAGGPTLTIDYTQINTAAEPARLALVESSFYGMPFQGYDYYQDGVGGMKGVIAKGITLFDQRGTEMDRAALVTYLAEILFLPSALFSDNIHFEEAGEDLLRATLTAYGQTVSGVFTFNDKAEMICFTTDDRYLAADDGTMIRTPWIATCGDYQRAKNGCLQPTTFKATWQMPDGDFTYFDGKISAITYDDRT